MNTKTAIILLVVIAALCLPLHATVTAKDCDDLAKEINLKTCAEESTQPEALGWYDQKVWAKAAHKARKLMASGASNVNQLQFLLDN